MTTRRDVRRGLAGPGLWMVAVVLTLGAVRFVAAAEDPAKAEAELRKSQDQIAALQAENKKLSDELLRKTAETRTYEERLTRLIEQVAEVRLELAAPRGKKAEAPKPDPKAEPVPADDGPTADRLKRLADEVRRQAEAARDAEEKSRRDADAREREARAVQSRVDPARLEAEVRAARLEAQLQVMQMAYQDLRKETSRLREELDAERKARHEATTARPSAADSATQQRLDRLEAQVIKISTILETLTKKLEAPRPDK